ncbi:hypothetical protein [Anaerotruncus colihominis]|uniref:hypothetical protein n=1 Tax=Anaerotruncus colihominis TaxID=169435 RepID=UPI00189C4313|nr:hypothetical protein [Anaerotruncus colihominis]
MAINMNFTNNNQKTVLKQVRKHWKDMSVLTDALYGCYANGCDGSDNEHRNWNIISFSEKRPVKRLAEDELLPGEWMAAAFQIGCYTIRSSWRAYQDYPTLKIPADEVGIEFAKK